MVFLRGLRGGAWVVFLGVAFFAGALRLVVVFFVVFFAVFLLAVLLATFLAAVPLRPAGWAPVLRV
ncbi:MAG: hypothetical protein AAGL18_05265, partial [Pseudomonadota bacterium]